MEFSKLSKKKRFVHSKKQWICIAAFNFFSLCFSCIAIRKEVRSVVKEPLNKMGLDKVYYDVVLKMPEGDYLDLAFLIKIAEKEEYLNKMPIIDFVREWINRNDKSIIDCLNNETIDTLYCSKIYETAIHIAIDKIFMGKFVENKIYNHINGSNKTLLKDSIYNFSNQLNVAQKENLESMLNFLYKVPSTSWTLFDYIVCDLPKFNQNSKLCQNKEIFEKELRNLDITKYFTDNTLHDMAPEFYIEFYEDTENIKEFLDSLNKFQDFVKELYGKSFFENMSEKFSVAYKKFQEDKKKFFEEIVDNIWLHFKSVIKLEDEKNIETLSSWQYDTDDIFSFNNLEHLVKTASERILEGNNCITNENKPSTYNSFSVIQNTLSIGKTFFKNSNIDELVIDESGFEKILDAALDYQLNKMKKSLLSNDESARLKNARNLRKSNYYAKVITILQAYPVVKAGVKLITMLSLVISSGSISFIAIPTIISATAIIYFQTKNMMRKMTIIKNITKKFNTIKIYTLPSVLESDEILPSVLESNESNLSQFRIRIPWIFIAHLNVVVYRLTQTKIKIKDIGTFSESLNAYWNNVDASLIKVTESYSKANNFNPNYLDEYKNHFKNNMKDFLTEKGGLADFIAALYNSNRSSQDIMNELFGHTWKEQNSMKAFTDTTGLGRLAASFNKDMLAVIAGNTDKAKTFVLDSKEGFRVKIANELKTNHLILRLLSTTMIDWQIAAVWSYWFGYKNNNAYYTASSWLPKIIPGTLIYCFTTAIVSSSNVKEFSLKFVVLYSYFAFMSLPAAFTPKEDYFEMLFAATDLKDMLSIQFDNAYQNGILANSCHQSEYLLNELINLKIDLSTNPTMVQLYDSKEDDLLQAGNVLYFLTEVDGKIIYKTVEVVKFKKFFGILKQIEIRILNDDNTYSSKTLTKSELKMWRWKLIMARYGKDPILLDFQTNKDLNVVSKDGEISSVFSVTINPGHYFRTDFITLIHKNNSNLIALEMPCVESIQFKIVTLNKRCFVEKYVWKAYNEEERTINLCEKVWKYRNSGSPQNTFAAVEEGAIKILYNLAEQSKLVTIPQVILEEAAVTTVVNQISRIFKELKNKKFFAQDQSLLIAGNILVLKNEKEQNKKDFLSVEILKVLTNKNYSVKLLYENNESEEEWPLGKLERFTWALDKAKYSQKPNNLIILSSIELLSKTGITVGNLPASFSGWIVSVDHAKYGYGFSYEKPSYTQNGNQLIVTTKPQFFITLEKLKDNYRWRDFAKQ